MSRTFSISPLRPIDVTGAVGVILAGSVVPLFSVVGSWFGRCFESGPKERAEPVAPAASRLRVCGIVPLALVLASAGGLSNVAATQPASAASMIRGSWITEREGERYIYIFAVKDEDVSGVVCRQCYDLEQLTFVTDGKVEGNTLSFILSHDAGGERYVESFRGSVAAERITLTVSRDAAPGSVQVVLRRPPSRVAEIFAEDAASRPRVEPESFMTPGPSEPLTLEGSLGVWRSPVGSTAYLFKQVGDRVMGIACDSRCEDGSYSAFIESATIRRNTFLASIVHVDNAGEPYANLLTLYLSQGRMMGTYVDTRRPERRVVHVMVRQDDPGAPKDEAWRGAF